MTLHTLRKFVIHGSMIGKLHPAFNRVLQETFCGKIIQKQHFHASCYGFINVLAHIYVLIKECLQCVFFSSSL